jgi:hypothetical protein
MIAFGGTYLLRSQFMPYHGVALGKDWSEAPKEVRILVLALMRAVAGGALALAALATLVLLIPFRAGAIWAFWAIPLGGVILSAGALHAMRLVAANTPAKPPYVPILVALGLTLTGLVLSLCSLT